VTPSAVDRARVRELAAAGAQLVEVLPRGEYDDAHLPGALNLPLKELNRQTATQLDRSRPLVVYCWDYQ
jgi:rhodanese-related sulfurtransferase